MVWINILMCRWDGVYERENNSVESVLFNQSGERGLKYSRSQVIGLNLKPSECFQCKWLTSTWISSVPPNSIQTFLLFDWAVHSQLCGKLAEQKLVETLLKCSLFCFSCQRQLTHIYQHTFRLLISSCTPKYILRVLVGKHWSLWSVWLFEYIVQHSLMRKDSLK